MPYKYVAGHVDVSDGRLVAYGDTLEEPDQRLIENGFVIPIEDEKDKSSVNPVKTKESDANASGN